MHTKDSVTVFHRMARWLRRFTPDAIVAFGRSMTTAMMTPVYFSLKNGHFKSSFKNKAVDQKNHPLPWYTYPAIDFLATRDFAGKTIVEFGGGQSSLWWSQRAANVITFEDNPEWFAHLQKFLPGDVSLHLVSGTSRADCVKDVRNALSNMDVVNADILVIDGLFREEMVGIACDMVSQTGAIICDNAEGYGFYEAFLSRSFQRVDFFGHTPGVMIPHSTSIYFKAGCFLFNPAYRIPGSQP